MEEYERVGATLLKKQLRHWRAIKAEEPAGLRSQDCLDRRKRVSDKAGYPNIQMFSKGEGKCAGVHTMHGLFSKLSNLIKQSKVRDACF